MRTLAQDLRIFLGAAYDSVTRGSWGGVDNWQGIAARKNWRLNDGEECGIADKSQRTGDQSDAHDSEAETQGRGEMGTPSNTAALDVGLLSALLGDLPDEVRSTILVQFNDDTRQRMAQISEGMKNGDLESIAAATHVLISLLGTFGAMYASELSANINQQIRSGAPVGELGMVPELLSESEIALAAILNFCAHEFATMPVAQTEAGEH